MLPPHKELYEFSRFRLDVSERLLLRDGKRVSLTDKAFDTLCTLVRRGGGLVGKDELMTEVWADAIVEENNLDQKISMLRQALGERGKGKEKFIETVRGRGYRFLPEVRRVEEESPKSKVQSPKFQVQSSEPEIPNPNRSGNVIALAKWRREGVEPDAVENPQEIAAKEERGEKQLEPQAESEFLKRFKQNKRATFFIAAALVIAVVAVFALSRFSDNQPQTSAAPIDSIAVLPFENVAQDANAEYLSDGITESLINRLSQLQNLKVMSRSAVFRYKGKEQDANKVGNELNVRAVLTGNVKQIGDQLIITVRLEDAQTNEHIWGEQYVRRFADVLDVQKEIVQKVSSNLHIKLTGADEQQIAKRYTESVEAYQLYLKGNYKWAKYTEEDLRQAIEFYTAAIERDPNYALAYTGLANCYARLGNGFVPPREAFPKAREYAAKALELDDALAEAHVSMALVKLLYDWNWAEGEQATKRALALDPNIARAYDLSAVYSYAMGRPEEALAKTKRAHELEPLALHINSALGEDFYFSRQYDEAIAQLEKTVSLEPRYYRAYLSLGSAYEQKKMYGRAIETFQTGIREAQPHPQLISSLGHAYALAGERDKAHQSLAELREMSKKGYVNLYLFAVVYLGLNDKEQTLAYLEKAFQDRSFFLIWLRVEPRFDSLRDDPRFQDLLRRIGLQP